MGNKYVKSRLKSDSQREAEYRKSDRFNARINMSAADPHWNAAYQHTPTTPDPSLFLNPDIRRTSPSSYLQESGSSLHPARSGSSSMHTDDQGQAEPSRPARVSSHHRRPVEQMEIIHDEQVYHHHVGGPSGYYGDIWAAGSAGSFSGVVVHANAKGMGTIHDGDPARVIDRVKTTMVVVVSCRH